MARRRKLQHIDPTVDCVFKKLLGSVEHKALTLDFVNAMLGLASSTKVSDLTFIDPHLHKSFIEDKRPVVDLMVTADTGAAIQVEVQATLTNELKNRFVFDWGKLLGSGLGQGDSYQEMRDAVSIWILTENLFPLEVTDEVVLKFRIACPEAGLELKPDSYILVVQLKNWKGHGTLDPAAERWIMLFREGKNLDLNHPPKCLDDEVMRMALEVMRNFAKDRHEYLRYEQEIKRRRVNEWRDAYIQRCLAEATRAKEEATRAQEQERAAREVAEARLAELSDELRRLRDAYASGMRNPGEGSEPA